MSDNTIPIGCTGRRRVTDRSKKWYIPEGKTGFECTYCEPCFNTFIKGTPREAKYRVQSNLGSCNCDYPLDYSKYSLEKDGYRVTVMSKDGSTMFEKVENTMANLNGVMHVDIPTCTEYTIYIENLSDDPDTYITFESGKVGEKEISVENGKRIYYPREFELKGFKTGSNDSFMFISQTDQEKSEGHELEGENERNVITVKVNKYRRDRVPSGFWSDRDLRVRVDPYCLRDYSRGARGGLESYNSSGSFGSSRASDCLEVQCNTLSGGTTVSGGSHVDGVRSQNTSDHFNPIEEPTEFMIQLVCSQSEEEKYKINKEYHMKNAMKERDELQRQIINTERDVDLFKKQVEKAEKSLQDEMEKLESLKEKIQKFDFLGSSDKRDHLIDLSKNNKVISIKEEQ